MPISRHDETDLLTVLYEGALDDPPWSAFLARLRRRAAADYAALLLRPAGAPADLAIEQAVAGFGSPLPRDRPMASLYRRAPSLYHALRPGRVYALAEFLRAGDADHEAYRRGWLAADTLGHLRLMRVRAPDGADAWLILGRAGQDFSAAAGSLLSALGAHLAIALRLSGAIDRQRDRAFVASAALRRLGFGWLTIDARGRLIDHDGHAGRLFPPGGPAGDEIAAILRRSDGRPHAVRISREPRVDVLIMPFPREAAAGAAVAAVYVDAEEDHAASTREARGDALRTLFGLSRNEARLADAISRGETIAAAAARIGITEQTARNYSKRIYARTATSGQADLARLVLTGLAGLA